jgi:hypothetical protein
MMRMTHHTVVAVTLRLVSAVMTLMMTVAVLDAVTLIVGGIVMTSLDALTVDLVVMELVAHFPAAV